MNKLYLNDQIFLCLWKTNTLCNSMIYSSLTRILFVGLFIHFLGHKFACWNLAQAKHWNYETQLVPTPLIILSVLPSHPWFYLEWPNFSPPPFEFYSFVSFWNHSLRNLIIFSLLETNQLVRTLKHTLTSSCWMGERYTFRRMRTWQFWWYRGSSF